MLGEVSNTTGVVIACVVVVGFFTALILASYLEWRLVDPYVEIDLDAPDGDRPPIPMLSRYVEPMSDGAMAAGFHFGSLLAHRKYPKIKIGGTVWISGDGRIVMSSGSGTVFGMPAKQTWLVTPRKDGLWVVTTDQNDEGDASGLERIKRVLNVPFQQLLAAHLLRIDADPSVCVFPQERPFDLLATRARNKYESMIRRGIARYRDPDLQFWSYSLGSSFGSIGRFFKQLLGAIPQTWRVKRRPVASPTADLPARELVSRWMASAAQGDEKKADEGAG